MSRRGRGLTGTVVVVGLSAAVGAAVILWLVWGLDGLAGYLIGINVATAAAYTYDKAIAGSAKTRIPERALLVLAFAGGSPAALVSMHVLRHKTAKSSFQVRFWLVVAVQVALVAAYYLLLKPRFVA
jgi:uncharacterized membrane protein YsdA (DUF1294 family)